DTGHDRDGRSRDREDEAPRATQTSDGGRPELFGRRLLERIPEPSQLKIHFVTSSGLANLSRSAASPRETRTRAARGVVPSASATRSYSRSAITRRRIASL